jgi:hypothetical protein
MKLAAAAIAVVLLAGCAVESAPTPTVTVTATPEAFTPIITYMGCQEGEPPDFAFLAWLNSPEGAGLGDGGIGPVGAVVTTETGEWAFIGAGNPRGDDMIYRTPNPPTPGAEVIEVGRLDLEGVYTSTLEVNTGWHGDLLALGEEAAHTTMECVTNPDAWGAPELVAGPIGDDPRCDRPTDGQIRNLPPVDNSGNSRPRWPDVVARVAAFTRDDATDTAPGGTRWIIATKTDGVVEVWGTRSPASYESDRAVSVNRFPGILQWSDDEIAAGQAAAAVASTCLG